MRCCVIPMPSTCRWSKLPRAACSSLEQDGTIVGFSAILPRDDGDTELDALFVEPSIQRRGIGRKLLEHCAEQARSAGSSALHVVGNFHAKQFYLACGFTIVGTFETRFGPGLLMRKTLRNP